MDFTWEFMCFSTSTHSLTHLFTHTKIHREHCTFCCVLFSWMWIFVLQELQPRLFLLLSESCALALPHVCLCCLSSFQVPMVDLRSWGSGLICFVGSCLTVLLFIGSLSHLLYHCFFCHCCKSSACQVAKTQLQMNAYVALYAVCVNKHLSTHKCVISM